MSDESRSLTFEQGVPGAPEAVYTALTNATALREWLCDIATTAPRVGGRCYLAWYDGYYSSGEFTGLVPGEEVAFSWHGRGEPAPSSVKVTLRPDGEGTRVSVVHDGIGNGAGWEEVVGALEQAWPLSLENLHSIFAGGEDLRFTQRPMLGITVSDFDATIAQRLGVPVSEGICLDGVVAEMGAGVAGLRENDVIVGVDGQEVVDWASLSNALQGRRAGDEVAVTFYRGPERMQALMTLSGRPLPPIPETIEELTVAVQERYDEIDRELRDFFEGVDEAQASYKSSPEAWSANEVLAHLIHSERGLHTWIADLLNGQEAWYDDWGTNLQARIEATVAAFATTDALLEELLRMHEETAAFVAHLPDSFLERKGSFWRLAFQLLETPYHHRTHLAQMREAIAAAR